MITFNNIFNLRKTNKSEPNSEVELVRAKIEFRIIASDVVYNEINRLLVLYTDENQNIQTVYNIASLIFLNFDYIDKTKPTVFFIFSKQIEDTSIRMFVNDNEVNLDDYNIIIKVVPYELINKYSNLNTANLL